MNSNLVPTLNSETFSISWRLEWRGEWCHSCFLSQTHLDWANGSEIRYLNKAICECLFVPFQQRVSLNRHTKNQSREASGKSGVYWEKPLSVLEGDDDNRAFIKQHIQSEIISLFSLFLSTHTTLTQHRQNSHEIYELCRNRNQSKCKKNIDFQRLDANPTASTEWMNPLRSHNKRHSLHFREIWQIYVSK